MDLTSIRAFSKYCIFEEKAEKPLFDLLVAQNPMKTFRRIPTLLGALFIVASCGSADDQINPLTGSWTLKGVSCQNCIDKSQIGSTIYACSDSDCNTYTFNEDGSLKLVETLSGTTTVRNGTYSISDATVRLNLDDQTYSSKTYCYTLSGSTLYLKEILDKSTGKCETTTVLSK